MKDGIDVGTPEIRSLRGLVKEPLPAGPVIIQMSAVEWSKLSEGLPVSKRRIGVDAKGMFVVPDPFGGFMGFLACAAGSDEGVACIPEIVRTRGGVTFGSGCTCLRGKDPVDRPLAEQDSCALGFTTAGKLTCFGKCVSGKPCRLVTKSTGGRWFVGCECG